MKRTLVYLVGMVLMGLGAASCQDAFEYDPKPVPGTEEEQKELLKSNEPKISTTRLLKNLDFSFSPGRVYFSPEGGQHEVLILDKTVDLEFPEPDDFYISRIFYSDPTVHNSYPHEYGYGEYVNGAIHHVGENIYIGDPNEPWVDDIEARGLHITIKDRVIITLTVTPSDSARYWMVDVKENHPDLIGPQYIRAFSVTQE